MSDPLYLDYAASTPLDPRAASAMAAVAALPGNPSSTHGPGRELRAAIDKARAQVARLLDVPEEEIVFTSGATEANGLAIRGTLRAIRKEHPGRALRIAVSGIEHASVMESARAAEVDGDAALDIIAADKRGVVTAEAVSSAIGPDTAIVAVMWANNVLGTLQPVAEIGTVVKAERARRGAQGLPIAFVCDAVQAVRTEAVRPAEVGADILTISSHKIYGPKGVGAMRLAPGTPFAPLAGGGGHEGGRRHGTENAAGIAGLGAAAEILIEARERERAEVEASRAMFIDALRAKVPSASLIPASLRQAGESAEAPSVPGIVFFRLANMRGDELALRLDSAGIAVSAGSACDAGTRRSPRVLASVLDEQSALRGGIRVSFGRGTDEAHLMRFVDELAKIAEH